MRWTLLAWVPIACLVSSGAGCGVDVVHLEVTEEGQAGGLALQFPGLGNFSSSLGRALSDKDVNPDDVDSMKVERIELALLSQGGLTDDLTFLEALSFLVSGEDLGPDLLASRGPFAAGERRVDLVVVEDLELKPYLQTGAMRIEVDATLAYPPPDVVDLEVTFHIRVDVNVL